MSTRILCLLLSVLSLSYATEVCLAGAVDGQVCIDFIAGQHIDVGQVCMSINANSLEIEITTWEVDDGTPAWSIAKSHIWVGLNQTGIPVTNSGNPQPGRFPYTCAVVQHDEYQTCGFKILLSDLYADIKTACKTHIFIAVHAEVQRGYVNGTLEKQTAWGSGTRFVTQGNWAMYTQVQILCDDNCGKIPPPPEHCETAYAWYNSGDNSAITSVCFTSLKEGNFDNWGWTSGLFQIAQPEHYYLELWAAAGQCDLSKGTLVGRVIFAPGSLQTSVAYEVFSGFGLEETQVYFGYDKLPLAPNGKYTSAPGQYPYKREDLGGADSKYYTINVTLTKPVYLVAHAVVCGNYGQAKLSK